MEYVGIVIFVCFLLAMFSWRKVKVCKEEPISLEEWECTYSRIEENVMVDGERIYGVFLKPENSPYEERVTGKLPVVICSHGLNGSYEAELPSAITLAKAGIATFVYDFRGGSRKTKSDRKMKEMSIFTEKADLGAVIDTMKKKDCIDENRIFLSGGSQGGFISAITAAEREEDVRALIMCFPAFCIPDDARKRYKDKAHIPAVTYFGKSRLSRAYNEEMYDYNVFEVIGKYKKDVCIIHGTADPVVNVSYSERAKDVYENAQLTILPGEGPCQSARLP